MLAEEVILSVPCVCVSVCRSVCALTAVLTRTAGTTVRRVAANNRLPPVYQQLCREALILLPNCLPELALGRPRIAGRPCCVSASTEIELCN